MDVNELAAIKLKEWTETFFGGTRALIAGKLRRWPADLEEAISMVEADIDALRVSTCDDEISDTRSRIASEALNLAASAFFVWIKAVEVK